MRYASTNAPVVAERRISTATRPAITLLAHGSPDPRHARGIERLADRVRRCDTSVPVTTCFIDHGLPRPTDVARQMARQGIGRTRVVPLLLAPAFHARVDIPAAVMAMADVDPSLSVEVTAQLGPDPRIIKAALELLPRAGMMPDPHAGVILTAPGSRDPRAVGAIDRVVAEHGEALAASTGWGGIRIAFLEGGRRISDAATLLRKVDGLDSVVCTPMLLADGILRDRMATSAHLLGLQFACGTLADTNEMAQLVLSRAASPALLG